MPDCPDCGIPIEPTPPGGEPPVVPCRHFTPDDPEGQRRRREKWHQDRIAAAQRFAHANPHLVDDYSDADLGL